MKVIRHVTHVAPPTRPRIAAVGRFDGVHVGHQRVLARCAERAAASGGEVIAVVCRLPRDVPALTATREQLERLRAAGVDRVVFARRVDRDVWALARSVRASVLVAGDTRLRGGSGDPPLDLVASVVCDGERVDADGVRSALARGDLRAATRMLGCEHAVTGRVIHGHRRGAGLGIPTANLRVRGLQLPPDGVYAVRARIGTREALGVANIGFNPTFGNRDRSLETHLLDFDGDLYGQRLRIAFAERLRGERKFAGVDALLEQIRKDILAARRLFDRHGG